MEPSAPCRCGRVLDWKVLSYSPHKSYSASVSCETCGATTAIINGSTTNSTSTRDFGTTKSPKGKGKEGSAGASEKYNYGRLQMLRLRHRYVYNPLQGYELEAPKYSGMLLLMGREWLVAHERRTACALCACKFDLFRWKYNCMACGEVVCASCSPKAGEVAFYNDKQRVCHQCFEKSRGSDWRERFAAIQSNVFYLRLRPVLDEPAKGCLYLKDMESCDRITQETLKSEAGVAPPVGFQDFCFKATFKTAGSESYFFCAKTQELMNSWIVAMNESNKETKESQKGKGKNINNDFVKACSQADSKKVRDLLKKGADPTYIKDKGTGITALMQCARSSKSDATLCATLILQTGTTPNTQDSSGRSAFVVAPLQAPSTDDNVLDVLLRYGADLSIEDINGNTPHELALLRTIYEAENKIRKYGMVFNLLQPRYRNILTTTEETGIQVTDDWIRKMLERGGSVNWRDGQGNTLLHHTCMQKQVNPLKFLIEHHINSNAVNLYGHAAAHVACISNFEEGLRILLEHKASIDIQDNMGYTPLHVAVIFNSEQCLKVLLNRGANPNIKSSEASGCVGPLHLAACLGYEKCAESLLQKGSDPNMDDDMGQTPMTIAKRFDTPLLPLIKQYTDLHKVFQWCREPNKRPDIEQVLLTNKMIPVNWQNGELMTMLHVATIAQNLPVVELLLSHHANFDIADSFGNTPIDIANGTEKTPLSPPSKNEKIHQRFLQYRRITALNDFIKVGSLPDVKRLLKEAPTEYNLHVEEGRAPLHIAAERGYVPICKRLMKGGARIDFLSATGRTPLHYAASEGRVDCLRMLLADPVGKSVINLGDSQGDTALLLCLNKDIKTLEETCELLLASGAEVEQKNRDGVNALSLSGKAGFTEVLTRHKNGIKILEAARRGDSKAIDDVFNPEETPKGVRPSADFQDIYGKTALHYACASQEGETCISVLLRNGARVEIRDNEQKTPLDVIKSRPYTDRTQRLITQFSAGIQVATCALQGQKQRMQHLLTKYNIDIDFCDQIEMKTPLHSACISGSRVCVEYLIGQGAVIDVKDKNSETPLFVAVRNGHRDLVEILLERGANPEISDATGKKLIECICDASRAKEYLNYCAGLFGILECYNVKLGANEEDELKSALQVLFDRVMFEKETLKPDIDSLLKKHINGRRFVEEYAEKGDLARMREMYQKVPELINYKCAGETALHRAVKRGYVDVVEDLLEQGALVSIENKNKQTPLNLAQDKLEKDSSSKAKKILDLLHTYGCGPDVINLCEFGKHEQLEEILSKNVPLGFLVDYKFKGDFTGLHIAACNGHLQCMEILLKYEASPDKQDADGFTPLHYAARFGKEPELKLLLEKGVFVDQKNDSGLTPLMMAAIGEHNQCVQILTSFGAEVNVKNNNNLTPLMLAAKSGFKECVALLLEKGANPNDLDTSNNSALHHATTNGYAEIIRLLLANEKTDPNKENRSNCTPLIIAAAKGNAALLSILLSSKAINPDSGSKTTPLYVSITNVNAECVKLLLEHNADPNRSVGEVTPLHRAVFIEDRQIIELLLMYGANPKAKSTFRIDNRDYKLTPLNLVAVVGSRLMSTQLLRSRAGAMDIHEAIKKGEITTLRILLNEYSDVDVVNYQDREGRSPLHWACEKEYPSCVKAILVFYPNLNMKDKDGNTAMAIARKNNNQEVLQELYRYDNATKLLKAVTDGNEKELKSLIEAEDVDLEFAKQDKNTCLHLCAAYGYLGCLKLLLTKVPELANRQNLDKQLPIHLAAERGHTNCVQELISYTKQMGNLPIHEELWNLAVEKKQRDVVLWLQSDLCSHKKLPKTMFPAKIEIEYRMGDLLGFLKVPEDVSLYELELQLYNKLKRYTILEQRIQQGRTQIRDDKDLKKAIATAKASGSVREKEQKGENKKEAKTVVVFYCVQNLENKPIAQPPSADNPQLKPITRLRTAASDANIAEGKEKEKEKEKQGEETVSREQYDVLKAALTDNMMPLLRDLTRDVKKVFHQSKLSALQGSDIYDEIQHMKLNDREFVSAN